MNRTYRQITCKRSVGGTDFDKGILDFDFSIGGKTVFIPSKSYFRIGLKLTKADGTTAPEVEDGVAFANGACGNLFDNCYFYAGGQNVSSIVNYAGQAHMAGYRLTKSGAWLNSVGKDAWGLNSSFKYRLQQASSNSTYLPSLAGKGTAEDIANLPGNDLSSSNTIYMMYQPPIGIMSHNKPMAAGDYRFQFNPNASYKTAIVQSLASEAGKTEGTDYNVAVESMELYICTEMMDVSPTGADKLKLMEHQLQSKPLGAAGEKNFDFTIPPSTKAISLFIQSGDAGKTTQIPPSLFGCKAGQQNTLKSLQLSYANITKPPTRWQSEFTPEVRKLQQRYLDTQIESTQAFSSGGCQTLQQWLDDGVLLHYSWVRDANDRSTQLQVQIDYGEVEANSNLFVIAHYSRSVDIEVSNGYVQQVTSLTI